MNSPEAFAEFMKSNWEAKPPSQATTAPIAGFTQQRRIALAAVIPDSVLLIPTGGLVNRSLVMEHLFRPGSDFLYLTGYVHPDAVLVLDTTNGSPDATLYLPEPFIKTTEGAYRDPSHGEFWVGPRPSRVETETTLGITCRPLTELEDRLQHTKPETTFVRPGLQPPLEKLGTPDNNQELAKQLALLRMTKDSYEIGEIRRAIATTHLGLSAVLQEIPQAQSMPYPERWLEGTFTRIARTHGGNTGYDSIMAAGNHATILHWCDNTGEVRDGDLLLIDAGAETDTFYSADVTRTFPIRGTFSSVQKDIYDLVFAANQRAIAAISPGDPFVTPHLAATEVLVDGLISLGILSKGTSFESRTSPVRRYMPHGTSHPLGLDVHDCSDAYTPEHHYGPLHPGTVLTIEPGLYFHSDDLTIPQELRGIGIRLEDDILVTHKGTEVLTAEVPLERDAVESWVQQSRSTSPQ